MTVTAEEKFLFAQQGVGTRVFRPGDELDAAAAAFARAHGYRTKGAPDAAPEAAAAASASDAGRAISASPAPVDQDEAPADDGDLD